LSGQALSIALEEAIIEISNIPQGPRVTLSGQLGDDAKPYQEREVRKKIQESQQ
jgi:hypothetical protein